MAMEPVITEKTGQQLVKALNGVAREIGLLTRESFEIGAVKVDTNLYAALDGAEIVKAYKQGRNLVLSLYDAAKMTQYRIALTNAVFNVNGDQQIWTFNFESRDGCNPYGSAYGFSIMYIIGERLMMFANGLSV